ncbi:MAG TPA: hypothetical protein VFF33_14300 [Ignavibacteriaceae bacterium]|nr:hypothetical protein [Ignavibacteriaceae bacterium]
MFIKKTPIKNIKKYAFNRNSLKNGKYDGIYKLRFLELHNYLKYKIFPVKKKGYAELILN